MTYANPRPAGIIAIALDEGDEVIGVRLTDGAAARSSSRPRDGQAIRFQEDEVRPMGRGAGGVRGMTLDEGDEVVGARRGRARARRCSRSPRTATASARTMDEYRLTRRGGKGIITMKTTEQDRPGRRRAHGDATTTTSCWSPTAAR